MKFKEKNFSELKYSEVLTDLQGYAQWVEEFRDALKSEGFEPTKETVLEADTISEFLEKHRSKYIAKLSPVPRAEQERIEGVYAAIGQRLNTYSGRAGSALRSGIELTPNGSVDVKKMEATARKAATTFYNVEQLSAYYEKVKKVAEAVNGLKEYQEKNGIPDLTRPRLFNGNSHPGVVFSFIDRDGTPDDFQNSVGQYFTKN